MSDLLSKVAAFCANRSWTHDVVGDPPEVVVTHKWIKPPYRSHATSPDGDAVLVYVSVCPELARAERRAPVAEYLGLVNHELDLGSFELRWDNGEVRCKTSLDLHGEPMTDALMEGVIHANHQAMLHYLPNLLQVMRGELEPQDGFAEAMNR